jgi:hypothetical protein
MTSTTITAGFLQYANDNQNKSYSLLLPKGTPIFASEHGVGWNGVQRLRRRPEPLLQNRGSANPIKFLTKLLYSFGSLTAFDEFGGRQARTLSECLNLMSN